MFSPKWVRLLPQQFTESAQARGHENDESTFSKIQGFGLLPAFSATPAEYVLMHSITACFKG
jgi:hypothetical protein